MFLFAYGVAVSEKVETSSNGKKTKGNSAVTNNGIASVAHKTAIKTPTAATYQASKLNPSGLGDKNKIKNKILAVNSP